MRGGNGILRDYFKALSSFDRNSRLFLLGQTLLWIGTNQVSLLLSLYLKRLGYSEDGIGSVLAMRALGSALVALPASFLAARLRLGSFLPIAAILTALGTVAMSLSASGHVILSSVFLAGSFSTVFQVCAGPFFMRNSRVEDRVHLFSLNGALSMGTGVIGSLLGGALKDLVFLAGYDEVFAYRVGLLAGALFILSAGLPFSRIVESSGAARVARKEGAKPGPPIGARLWVMLLLPNFFVGLGAGLTIPYLNLYFKRVFSLGDTAIGAAVAAGQVATFIGMAVGPALARRLGKARSVFATQMLSVPLILVLAWLHFLPLALLAYLLRQALMNMATPIQDIFALELVPPERMMSLNAVKMLVWTGSWTISARLSGWLIWAGGFGPSFTLTAFLYALSSILFWFFFLRGQGRPGRLEPDPPAPRL